MSPQRSDDLYSVPEGIPRPVDDGACDHLPGLAVPSVVLASTDGTGVDLGALRGRSVVYCFPRTGRPDRDTPAGWNATPGARGCTPQSCSFRDQHGAFREMGVRVFGMSVQDTDYQREAAERLHLPFPLLSDERLEFSTMLGLPTFDWDGSPLLRRVTLILSDGAVEHVFYPVFPPDANADEVLEWLRA